MPFREYDVARWGEARDERLRERPFGVGNSRSSTFG